MTTVRIKELPLHAGQKVTVNGWLYNKRTSGKLQFPIIRDGSGSPDADWATLVCTAGRSASE